MASVNKKEKTPPDHTHGGAVVKTNRDSEELLRRSVMSCLLWEGTFYEDGETVADRIKALIPKVDAQKVAELAIEARSLMNLRHVPLLIVREMARTDTHKHLVARTLEQVIQRPDEITEFMAIYHKDGKDQPVSAQVKKGLAAAFKKFNAYDLAKYNRDGDFKLRDVLFLSHSKPVGGVKGFTKKARKKARVAWPKTDGSILYRQLVEDKLPTPETWETMLSAGKDKKSTWESLIKEKKLGALALIRNLRNFEQVGVDQPLVSKALAAMKVDRVLPFRFLIAGIHAPRFEADLEQALFRACETRKKLPGKTVLIVDVSGSMYGGAISKYSDADRARVACSLAVLVRECCENPVIYATAGNDYSRVHKTQLVPARRGFALSDAVYKLCHPLGGGGIFLKQVMDYVKDKEESADRVIVITDEQDCGAGAADSPGKAETIGKHNYIINVSSDKTGIGYGKWTHISGWSEAVLEYIRISEEGENHAKGRNKKTDRRASDSLQ